MKSITQFKYNLDTKSFSINPGSEDLMKQIMDLYPQIQFFKAVEPYANAYYANKDLAEVFMHVVKTGSEDDLKLLSDSFHISIDDIKTIKGEFIVYGKRFADVYTLSHELGHHHHTVNGNVITKGAHKLYGIDKYRRWVNLGNIGLCFWKGKRAIPYVAASNIALSLPQLTAEAAASNKGIKILRDELKLDKGNIKEAKKDLRGAFNTYLISHLIKNAIPITLFSIGTMALGKEHKNSDLLVRRTDSEATKLAKRLARNRLEQDRMANIHLSRNRNKKVNTKTTIYDKAIWHIDAGENKKTVLDHFTFIMNWLQENRLLSNEGIEILKLGIDESISINSRMLNERGNRFMTMYYDSFISAQKDKKEEMNKKLKTI